MEFMGEEAGFSGGGGGVGGGGNGFPPVPVVPTAAATLVFDIWVPGGFSDNPAPWATDDDYPDFITGEGPLPSSHTPSIFILDGTTTTTRPSQTLSGNDKYPSSNYQAAAAAGEDSHFISTNRYRAIAKMFFKTKLYCKFRVGVCPYVTNCNFAHGIEELRKPPPNWQEIIAAHEGDCPSGMLELREEHQIPIISSPDSRPESQRSSKGRHCKNFFTDGWCPYGDNCTFLHDNYSRTRESVAISVTPTFNAACTDDVTRRSQKPSNWKTRLCNKWEKTGY